MNDEKEMEEPMKAWWIIGILFISGIIMLGESSNCQQKRAKVIMYSITVGTMILAITLVFQPNLPGPTQVIKLTFGWVDKLMK
jgi:hypothetical protein